MSASPSHLTPAKIFGERLRELRERRRWTQGELAERAGFDRTTVNKIEKGTRSDVSISQLFRFAEVLGTSPINLLTPGTPDATVQLSLGGRVMTAADARWWIRGVPSADADPLEAFFDMPIDEQRNYIRRQATGGDPPAGPTNWGSHLGWAALGEKGQEDYINQALETLETARREKKQ